MMMTIFTARDGYHIRVIISFVDRQTLRSQFGPSSLRRDDIDLLTIAVAENDAVHIFCSLL